MHGLNAATLAISVRNVIDGSDREMPTLEFIDKCRATALVESDTGEAILPVDLQFLA
jgi:hypothetical protein